MLAVALWLAGVTVAALVMAYLQRRFAVEARKEAIGPAVVGVIAPGIVTPADFTQRVQPARSRKSGCWRMSASHIARQRLAAERPGRRRSSVLFWFNPLIHLAAHLMRIDQEVACDETVVTRFPDARRAYAQVLVKAQLAIRPLPLGCYWPSKGTEHPLLERIAMLKRHDLPRCLPSGGGRRHWVCFAPPPASPPGRRSAWRCRSPQSSASMARRRFRRDRHARAGHDVPQTTEAPDSGVRSRRPPGLQRDRKARPPCGRRSRAPAREGEAHARGRA